MRIKIYMIYKYSLFKYISYLSRKKKTTVVLGAHSLSRNETEKQIFQITRNVPHPKYNKKTKEHDIMLLQVHFKTECECPVKSGG